MCQSFYVVYVDQVRKINHNHAYFVKGDVKRKIIEDELQSIRYLLSKVAVLQETPEDDITDIERQFCENMAETIALLAQTDGNISHFQLSH